MNENSLRNLQKFQPGVSGNPHGRPRTRLTDRFVQDLATSWERHGARILESLAKKDARFFADLCARLIPKDVSLTVSARLPGDLSPPDWEMMLELLNTIKAQLPDDRRTPGTVAELVTEALRLHSAKLVEG